MEISLDTASMIAALLVMAAVVAVKILTRHLIHRMEGQIALVEQERKQNLGQLKTLQAREKVAGENKLKLEAKKMKLAKKMKQLEAELNGFKEEGRRRRQKSEELRGKLVRPN